MATDQPSITCPKCGMTSYSPDDIQHRYCGNCHLFHDEIPEVESLPPRDVVAENKRLNEGKPVAILTSQLTDLELHLIRTARPPGPDLDHLMEEGGTVHKLFPEPGDE